MSRRLKRAVKRLPLFAICRKAIRRTTAIVEGLKYLDARVWQRERGNRCIYQALVSGEPQAIGKLGSTELLALKAHLASRHCPGWAEATTFNRHQLYVYSGVYPEQPEIYRRFCDYVLRQVLPEMTVVGVWFKPGEAHILRHYAHHASRVPSRSLETYYSAGHRWTSALRAKRCWSCIRLSGPSGSSTTDAPSYGLAGKTFCRGSGWSSFAFLTCHR